jgi:hypothetical protein
VCNRMEESGEKEETRDEGAELRDLLAIERGKNLQYQQDILFEKEQKNILHEQLNKYQQEIEQCQLAISDSKRECEEKAAYIQLLEARAQENLTSANNDLNLTISNQEATISSLEEKIQLLEHEVLLLKESHLKEIEGYKVDRMNVWIKIQVDLPARLCSLLLLSGFSSLFDHRNSTKSTPLSQMNYLQEKPQNSFLSNKQIHI